MMKPVRSGNSFSASSTKPDPIDRHVGNRIKMRRLAMNMSQTKLGHALGVTFQQIQKYETGANRISASRLQQVSEALNVPPSFFFDKIPSKGSSIEKSPQQSQETQVVIEFMHTAEGILLNQAFARIGHPEVRKRIVDLVLALAESE